MPNKSEYQMTKIQNMFRTLENLNFIIVSACDELSRVDFEFRASNFRTLCDRIIYASYYWETTRGEGTPVLPRNELC